MNTVTLIGRLGKDPTLRYTANERAVCEFPLAVDNRYSDEPDWFTIVAWGKTAETVAEYKTKGDQVAILGHLTPVRWETDNGDKRSTVKVTADSVTFLNRKQSSSDPQSEQTVHRPSPSRPQLAPAGRRPGTRAGTSSRVVSAMCVVCSSSSRSRRVAGRGR